MLTISQYVRFSDDQDGAVLLDLAGGIIYGLNPVGSRILALLSQGLDENQIKSEISREFSVDVDVVRSDVDEFLAQLLARNLIARNGHAPRSTKP